MHLLVYWLFYHCYTVLWYEVPGLRVTCSSFVYFPHFSSGNLQLPSGKMEVPYLPGSRCSSCPKSCSNGYFCGRKFERQSTPTKIILWFPTILFFFKFTDEGCPAINTNSACEALAAAKKTFCSTSLARSCRATCQCKGTEKIYWCGNTPSTTLYSLFTLGQSLIYTSSLSFITNKCRRDTNRWLCSWVRGVPGNDSNRLYTFAPVHHSSSRHLCAGKSLLKKIGKNRFKTTTCSRLQQTFGKVCGNTSAWEYCIN